MLAPDLATAISDSLDGLRLLDHPFYRNWQEGLLSQEDLARYAEQYRFFEQVLPSILTRIAGDLPEGGARELVERNLEDETSRPEPHVKLFEGFAGATGARPRSELSEATWALIDLYRHAAEEGPVPALAVVGAYEVQAGEIAASKAASLSDLYGMSADGTRFWDVHSAMEADHAAWTTQALADLDAGSGEVADWASRSASAWWSFLDDRLACSAPPAG